MNEDRHLLEIFPGAAFWYHCSVPMALLDLERMRAIAVNSGASHNENAKSGRCYYLEGDALWFDFQPQSFDLIVRSNGFGIFHSFIIDRKCERWLKSSGLYRVLAPGVKGLKDLFSLQDGQIRFCNEGLHGTCESSGSPSWPEIKECADSFQEPNVKKFSWIQL